MASWMIHLRIAQQLYEALEIEAVEEFVLGNIAPDSGVPTKDGTGFVPDASITHFRTLDEFGIKQIHVDQFISQYFMKEQRSLYSKEEYAFFLGYVTHLVTDQIWARDIVYSAKEMFSELFHKHRNEFWQKIKGDWYDLDFIFLKEHPDFEAYQRYLTSTHLQNHYLDFFDEDAFIKRRSYIKEFYRAGIENLVEHETYLSNEDLNAFVISATNEIRSILMNDIRIHRREM